jgi:hypothetical protein
MSTKYQNLISRLQKARRVTPRKNKGQIEAHRAACLLCDAKGPVSVALNSDGTILFNSFCSCGTDSTRLAYGINWSDIMPDQAMSYRKPTPPNEWLSIATLTDAVSWAVAIAANDPSEKNLAGVVYFADALHRASKEAMRSSKGARDE